jgi:hypothetical protein
MLLPSQYEELFERMQSHDDWMTDFALMTKKEFGDFFTWVFEIKLEEVLNFDERRASTTVVIKITLLSALCLKMLEVGHFADGVSEEWRKATIGGAEVWITFLLSTLSEQRPDIHEQLSSAWQSSLDMCERFGYRSGTVFEVLAPHKVFADL